MRVSFLYRNGLGKIRKGLLGLLHLVILCLWFVPLHFHSPFLFVNPRLSQIPNFYTLLDRISYTLTPSTGLLSVVDFYTSGKQPSLHERAIGGEKKECGWLSRWFWQIWFDFDHISLSPLRRDYLEYKFGTVCVGLSWIYYVLTSHTCRSRAIMGVIVSSSLSSFECKIPLSPHTNNSTHHIAHTISGSVAPDPAMSPASATPSKSKAVISLVTVPHNLSLP